MCDVRRTANAVLLLLNLSACAGQLDTTGPDELSVVSGQRRWPVPYASADAGPPSTVDAGLRSAADGGLRVDEDSRSSADAAAATARDAAAEPLYPSFAVGANPGDFCSPVSEQQEHWARCEARRGLRCRPPSEERADSPSTCACPPGATFEGGTCSSSDWSGVEIGDAENEPLGASTALGANPGDPCMPGAFRATRYAECDDRRGLVCWRRPPSPGRFDVVTTCMCPEASTFVNGVCIET